MPRFTLSYRDVEELLAERDLLRDSQAGGALLEGRWTHCRTLTAQSSSPGQWPHGVHNQSATAEPSIFAELFGLRVAGARLATLLVDGLVLADAAAGGGITTNTACG